MFKEFYNLKKEVAELDGGSQFKIFDRVCGRIPEIQSEDHSMIEFLKIMTEETLRAMWEREHGPKDEINSFPCTNCKTSISTIEYDTFFVRHSDNYCPQVKLNFETETEIILHKCPKCNSIVAVNVLHDDEDSVFIVHPEI